MLNREDRTGHGGGVATYIKETLKPRTLSDLQTKFSDKGIEVTADIIEASGSLQSTVILGIYRPPCSKVAWFSTFKDLILEVLLLGPVIIMGDLNSDLCRPKVYPGKLLLEALELAGTKVRDIFPTRITPTSQSCLDIIAVPSHICCSTYKAGSLAASDHLPVEASIIDNDKTVMRPILKRLYRKIDMNHMKTLVSNITIGNESNATPDVLLSEWQNSMIATLDQVAPMKPYPRKREKPKVINADIRFLLDRRRWLAKQVQSDPTNSAIHEELRISQRRVKSNIRRLQKVRGEKMLKENDIKGAWKFIREVTFTAKKDTSANVDPGAVNEFFASTVRAPTPTSLQVPHSCDLEDCFSIQQLSCYQVERMLSSLHTDTATGPDELPAFLLKDLAGEIAPNITTIINSSITHGIFPELWKKANVAAIWKNKGSKSDPSNYRPISILPVLARMVEKEIARQLTVYCDNKHIIPNQQFGFRAKSGCEIALIHALDSWMGSIDEGSYVGALLVDLSKAFDTVPHQKLLMRLADIGCSVSALNWFSSYLTDRMQRVVQPSVTTEWKSVTRGAPQGGGLSPRFFNIYVRGLPTASNSRAMQFADDLTISESGRNLQEIATKLTHSFNNIKSFCDDHELMVNATKTQLIVLKVPGKKIPTDFEVSLDGCDIKPATSVKLLGVVLDQHLTFGEHIENTSKKCHGILGALTRASHSLSRDLLRLAYIALVRSRLEYCSAAFASASRSQLNKLDVIQRIGSRVICGAARNAHSAPLLEALNLDSLDRRRSEHTRVLVNSFITGDCHPAMRDMFTVSSDGKVLNDRKTRIGIGQRRFSVYAADKFNCSKI